MAAGRGGAAAPQGGGRRGWWAPPAARRWGGGAGGPALRTWCWWTRRPRWLSLWLWHLPCAPPAGLLPPPPPPHSPHTHTVATPVPASCALANKSDAGLAPAASCGACCVMTSVSCLPEDACLVPCFLDCSPDCCAVSLQRPAAPWPRSPSIVRISRQVQGVAQAAAQALRPPAQVDGGGGGPLPAGAAGVVPAGGGSAGSGPGPLAVRAPAGGGGTRPPCCRASTAAIRRCPPVQTNVDEGLPGGERSGRRAADGCGASRVGPSWLVPVSLVASRMHARAGAERCSPCASVLLCIRPCA